MRVLVTGHKGYIGTVLVPMLHDQGWQVTGIDSDLYRSCTFGSYHSDFPEIIRDFRDIKTEELEAYDTLIHLAGLSNDPLGDIDPELTFEINYTATVDLARRAKRAGVRRFIFSSTCSTYGAGSNNLLDEDAPLRPVTPYGESKKRAEKELRGLADANFSPVMMRSGTAYGVSPRLRFDLVLNNLVAWAVTTGRVHLKSDGSAWRPLVHIEDISRAFIAAVQAPRERVHGQSFNVGRDSENFRVRDLAKTVCDVVPESSLEFAEGAFADKRNYRVGFRKIHQVLPGYKPSWDITRGARELYDAISHSGLSLEEFEGIRYQRVAHIRHLLASGKLDRSLRWTPGCDDPN